MDDSTTNSDLMENEWPELLYSQSYEDILATAVLNKVIEQHQRKNFPRVPNVESELVTPDTPSSLLSSMSPTSPTSPTSPLKDEKNIQTQIFVSKGVQAAANEDESESDAGTESAGDDFSWSDKRLTQPVSYTIEEQIEEITTTIEDSESETETRTSVQKPVEKSGKCDSVVTKSTVRDSGLPDFDFLYAELNFDDTKKVPFSELGVDVVEPTVDDDQVDGQEKDVSIIVSDVESWEDNWRFRKKALASPYGNMRGRIVVCDEPVPMLIPNPDDPLIRTRIGSMDVDELSDLSEKNSDDSMDASTSDTDSELCFHHSPKMSKKMETDLKTSFEDSNETSDETQRLTPSPKPTPMPRKSKNLTTSDVPFVLHSPPKSIRPTPETVNFSIPEFVHQLQDEEIVEGNAAIFTCKVSALPEPQIKWYLEGVEIFQSSNVNITNHGSGSWTLELLGVTFKSSGFELMAVASNPLGQSTSSAYLNVVEIKKPEMQSLTRRVNNTQDQVHVEAEKMLVSTNQLSELSRQMDNVDNTITRLEIQFQQRTWEERQAELQRDAIHDRIVEENASAAIRQVTGRALDVLAIASDVIDDNKDEQFTIADREHKKWLNPTGVIPNNPYSPENLVKRAKLGKNGFSSHRTSGQMPVDVDELDGKNVDLSRVDQSATDNTNTDNETQYRRDYFINGNNNNNITIDNGTRNSLNVVEETMYVRAGKMSCLEDKVSDLESQVEQIEDTTSSRHMCDLEDKVVYAAAQITHNENQLSVVETQVNRLQKSLELNNSNRIHRSHSDISSWHSPKNSTSVELNKWTSLQNPVFQTGSLERLNVIGQKRAKSFGATDFLSKKLSTSVSCIYRPPSTENVFVSTRNVREEVPNLPNVKLIVSKYQEGLKERSSQKCYANLHFFYFNALKCKL